MNSRIVMIRHGITEGNLKRWFYGAADIPLSEQGERKLEKLSEEGFYPELPSNTAYYTTGLKRTEQTLGILYGDVEHEVIPELQEMNFGEYECKSFDELNDDPVFLEWGYDRTDDVALPGGESRNEFRARVKSGLKKLLALHNMRGEDASTLMICHGGVISMILEETFPGERESMWEWMPEPGYGYDLKVEGGKIVSAEVIGNLGDSLQDAIKEYSRG